MSWISKLKVRLTGLTDAVARFPLTTLFLLAAAIMNAYMIGTEKNMMKFLFTFVVGAFLSAVSQAAYERYFSKISTRLLLMGMVIVLTLGYYLIIRPSPQMSMEMEIRTTVALFALFIAFIWIPVIKSEISFNKSFMIAFKSFFNSLFFSGVLFGGLSIILAATDQLIFQIDYKAYEHTANIIFIIFAPMYFLSLIPKFLKPDELNQSHHMEKIEKDASCPKFLVILISYILIPLLAVFTLILLIYIVQNIAGDFWTSNLLEPMLVSYAITVIFVYILASEIDNKFTNFFRRIFPKVLVPIVLFQITASVLILTDTGVTHTRYFVILFGIFAAAAGILLSFIPVRKNGAIAAMLILFSVISIVPPIDAFTISRTSQINTLREVLEKNNMLENGKIIANESISDEDKKTITNAIFYLEMMNYTKEITWLPEKFSAYKDFHNTFGFSEYYEIDQPKQSVYLTLEQTTPMNITGYDIFVKTVCFWTDKKKDDRIIEFSKQGNEFTLIKDFNNNQFDIKVLDKSGQELINFSTQEILDKFYDYNKMDGTLTVEEATFTTENEKAKMTILVENIGIEKQNKDYNNANLFVFVQIK